MTIPIIMGATGAPALTLDFVNAGADPRLTTTRAAGGATFFDSTGTLQMAAANAQRIDYDPATLAARGLLVEEARTNGTRNARAEGSTNGVIGSGGVLPTNASVLNTSGLTFTVIGTGTETGLPYFDLQISGTSTNNVVRLALETTTAIAAADTQVWTNSLYCRLVGGNATNITTIQLTSADYTSVPALIGFNGATTFAPTAAALASQRVTNTSTLSGATIASIQGPIITLNLNSTTAAVSITLRISCPQCELGAFATSPILPAIGTPAATTRAKDLVTMAVAWVNTTQGTMACEEMFPQAIPSGSFPTLINLSDNSSNNNINLFYDGTFTRYRASVAVGGVGGFDSFAGSSASVIPAAVMKAAIAWASGSGAFEVNPGSSPVAIYSAALTTPPGLTTLAVGSDAAGAVSGARYVRKVRYWPRALSSPELQAATT